MTTSISGFSPSSTSGGGGSLLDSISPTAGLPQSAIADLQSQIQASPSVVPDAAPPFGDAGDWGRWGAVAAGTTLLAPKVSTSLSQPLRNSVINKIRLDAAPEAVRSRVAAMQAANGTQRVSMLGALKDSTAGARSVFSKFGSNVVQKAATKIPTGRTVVNLASGAAKAIGPRIGPKLAGVGARIGLRLALFAIPGPGWAVGLAVLAASWLFDSSMRRFVNNLVGKLFGTNNSPAVDAPPEPPRTQFLPLTHDGDRDSVIDTKDAEMVAFNNAAFAFDPAKIWHPTAPAIANTPTFEASSQIVADLMATAKGLREELDAIFRKYQDEQIVAQSAAALKSTLDSLEEFGFVMLPVVSNLIANTATDTSALYMKLRDANSSARQEISNSGAGLMPWTANVEAGNMGNLVGEFETFAQQMDANIKGTQDTFAQWTQSTSAAGTAGASNLPDILNPGRDQSGRVVEPPVAGGTNTPLPYTPKTGATDAPKAGTADSSKPDATKGLSKDELMNKLKEMGVEVAPTTATPASPFGQANPQASNPFESMANGTNPFASMGNGANPFASQMSNPLGNGLAAAAQPAAAATPKVDGAKLESKLRDLMSGDKTTGVKADSSAADKLKATAAESAAKEDGKATEDVAAEETVDAPAGGEAVAATPVAAPTDALPDVLGINADAPADEAKGEDAAQSKSAEIGGKTVEFTDPRSARMAEIMNPTDGTSAPTVQEAAKQAGYTLPAVGEPIGSVVPTADLRPGDLIMGEGDRNGLYLGDEKVLSGGEVRPVSDIAHFSEDGQGIFRLEDAAAPAVNAQAVDAPSADNVAPATDSAPAAEVPASDAAPAPAADAPPAEAPSEAIPPTDSGSTGSGMPLPAASILTSDTDQGSSPAVPSVPVGD